MGARIWRGLAITTLAAALLTGVLVVAQTPWARARALAWAEGALSAQYHVALTAQSLDYNLVTRRVSLLGVRLAEVAHSTHPFFSAARIDARLPWSVYRGAFSIDQIAIADGTVTIERGDDGTLNIPAADGPPAGPTARRLDLRGLSLRRLGVRYADTRRALTLTIPAIEAELVQAAGGPSEAISGVLAVRGATIVRAGDRLLSFAPTETRLEFDGSSITLAGLRLAAAEADLMIEGQLRRVLDVPALALDINGTADLATAAAWVAPPIAVTGRLRIRGTVAGPASAMVADLRASGTDMSVGLEHHLRIEGPVRVAMDEARSDGLTITPSTGGSVTIGFDVPFSDAPSHIEAEWRQLDARSACRLSAVTPPPVGAALDGHLTFTSGPTRRLDATNRAEPKSMSPLLPLRGTAHATLVGDAWSIEQAHETIGLSIAGTVTGRLDRSTYGRTTVTGHQDVHVGDVADAARSIAVFGSVTPGLVREARGAVDAPLDISGTLAEPIVSGAISARDIDVPSVGRTSLTAHIDLDSRRLQLSTIEVHHGSAALEGEVAVNMATRALTGTLRFDAADAADLQASVPADQRISGPVSVNGTLNGSIGAFRLDSTMTGSAMRWAGQTIDRVSAAVSVTPDTIDTASLQIEQGRGRLAGRVRYRFESGAYEASLKGDGLTYDASLVAPSDMHATASVQFEGAGTVAAPRGVATGGFTVAGGAAATMVGSGTYTIELLGDQARVQAHVPALDALVTGTVTTAAPYDYRAIAVLNRVPLEPLATLTRARSDAVHGAVSLTATASGQLASGASPEAFVNLQDIAARIGGVPVTLTAPARITWTEQVLTVDGLDVGVGTGRLTASGAWSAESDRLVEGTFTGAVEDAVSIARAFDMSTPVEGTGNLTLALRWSGDPSRTTGRLTLSNASLATAGGVAPVTGLAVEASLAGESLTVTRLAGHVSREGLDGDFSATAHARVPSLSLIAATGTLTVDAASFMASGMPIAQQRPSIITVAGGVVTASDVAWAVADNPLTLSGTVDFAPQDPVLDLSLDGGAYLRVLSALLPTLAFDGGAAVAVRMTGTPAALQFNGEIDLESAEIAIANPRLIVSDLSGPIRLTGDRLRVGGVTGLANGGTVTLNGELRLGGRAIADGDLAVAARDVTIDFPKGLRSELDAQLSLRLGSQAPMLTGDVRVLRGEFTDTITLAALAASATARPVLAANATYLDSVRLDIAVTTVENVSVNNNYGRFDAGGSVRVVGRIGEPGMTGRMTLDEGGQIFLAGRTFTLTRGDVSFTNLRRIDPEFAIAASAQIGGDDVKMTLTGTIDRPTLNLTTADRSKTPGDLAAEIVGGGVSAENAIALLSGDLLGLTGRAIGLDTLRVERGGLVGSDYREDPSLIVGQADPAMRLTIAKRLRSNVEVTLSQNLSESGKTTVVVSYLILPNLELRALSRDNATAGLAVRHHVTIGGSRERPASRARADAPLVSTLTFTGATPVFDAWARQHVRLTPGRRFAYIPWQADIDRLRARLHAQGFFEARLRARRTVAADARSVALDYAVEAGPATTLTVDGVVVPATERRDLEEAWTRSGFDRYLIADLSRRLGVYLVSAGYLGSRITGVVERPAHDAKHVRLEVAPGARVARREIDFTGNAGLSRARLQSVVASAGLDLTVWLDPAAIEESLRAAYRAEGYLRATVTAGPVRISGDIARLPVEIVEGRQSQIVSVRWSGVADARVATLQQAAGLNAPAPFVASAMVEASRRVERSYRSRGFNSVQVDASPDFAPDGTVTLTFVVVEGPQQMLRHVETAGARRKSEAVITDALRLPIGEPVNLDDWAQARKRLYDTNVFRHVDVEPVAIAPATGGVQPIRAQVTVQENPSWLLRYGAQLEGDRTPTLGEFAGHQNLGLETEIKTPNLFGRALAFGLFGRYQYDRRDATLYLSGSRFLGLAARSSVYSFYSRDRLRDSANEVAAFSDQVGVTAEQKWRTHGLQVVYSYHFERNHTFDPQPQPNDPSPLNFWANLGHLAAGVILDRRDDALNGRRGTFTSVSLEQSARWMASDITNRKLLAQQFVFVPIGRVVLASRALAGTIIGPDEPLPRDRFKAGGSTTVRGYGEETLGPRDLFDLPSGGRTMMVLNQEARFPMYRWVSGVGFFDAGGIAAHGTPLGAGRLKFGYGFGLRVSTPLGLVRADFGIPGSALAAPSSRAPNTLGGGRWYFGIGHVF